MFTDFNSRTLWSRLLCGAGFSLPAFVGQAGSLRRTGSPPAGPVDTAPGARGARSLAPCLRARGARSLARATGARICAALLLLAAAALAQVSPGNGTLYIGGRPNKI